MMTVPGQLAISSDNLEILIGVLDAIADELNILALLHNTEPDVGLLKMLKETSFPQSVSLELNSSSCVQGIQLLNESLKSVDDEVAADYIDALAVDFADIYLTYKLRASPNESVWLDEDHLEKQKPMFKIREFYRRYGLCAKDWRTCSEDHLVLQIQFIAHLFSNSKTETVMENMRNAADFMDHHLLCWLSYFTRRVSQRCATDYFAGLALITEGYISAVRDLLVDLGIPRLEQNENENITQSEQMPANENKPLQSTAATGPVL